MIIKKLTLHDSPELHFSIPKMLVKIYWSRPNGGVTCICTPSRDSTSFKSLTEVLIFVIIIVALIFTFVTKSVTVVIVLIVVDNLTPTVLMRYTFADSSSKMSFFPHAATWAKYEMTFFVFSVLPAPDSPLQWQTIHSRAQQLHFLQSSSLRSSSPNPIHSSSVNTSHRNQEWRRFVCFAVVVLASFVQHTQARAFMGILLSVASFHI